MKKRLFVILATLVLVLAAGTLVREAKADGPYATGCEAWLKAAMEEASAADHIIGGDNGIEDKQSMTIIMPGETVAIVPETGVALAGIQGGISSQTIGIIQLNEPVVNKDYLKTSEPVKTTFTELKKKEVPFFYGERDVTGDPVRATEGPVSVEYVSLYRNDTGLPVLVRGQHWQSGRALYTKTTDSVAGCGRDSVDGRVNFQTWHYINYAPIFWFVEPYYDITLWTKTSSGTPYEWWTDDYKTTYKLYVDRQDHTYVFDNPMVEGWCFLNWEEKKVPGTAFPIKDNGTLANGKTTFTWNMQTQLTKNGDLDPQYFTADHELAGIFLIEGRTIRFDANGGKINGKKTQLVESGHDDEYTVSPKDYKPVREGYVFLGWAPDKDKPEELLPADASAENSKDWFKGNHMVLYAAWKRDPLALNSVKLSKKKAAVKEEITITAVTSTSATKLIMYTGGKEVTSWTKGYTDKDGVRTWKVTCTFTKAGERTLDFKAADKKGKLTAEKTAKITITKAATGLTLDSVKFVKKQATAKQKVTINAVTSTSATKLIMYNGSKEIQSWTKGYTDKDGKRTWKVTCTFTKAGARTMSFKAADKNGKLTAAKTAKITITEAPTLSKVAFSTDKAKRKETITVTAVTSTNVTKLTMYVGDKAVTTWTEGYKDKNGKRIWTVTCSFASAGERTVGFKGFDANGASTAKKTVGIEITK